MIQNTKAKKSPARHASRPDLANASNATAKTTDRPRKPVKRDRQKIKMQENIVECPSESSSDELDAYLRARAGNGGCETILQLHGFATAMILEPDRASLERIVAAILGGNFVLVENGESIKQRQRMVEVLLDHLWYVQYKVKYAPVSEFAPYFHENEIVNLVIEFMNWCTGFMKCVNLSPIMWAPLLRSRKESLVLLGAICDFGFADFKTECERNPAIVNDINTLRRTVKTIELLPSLVAAIIDHWYGKKK